MPRDLGLDYPASEASQPITVAEAKRAEPTICRQHGGRILHGLTFNDHYGKVYFCPVGKLYWRLEEQRGGLYAPLKFPKGM